MQSLTSRLRPGFRGSPEPTPLPPGGGQALSPSAVRERRDALARRLTELQFDLGGLTYEMAVRDHFRLDVLVARAAELQRVDADLAEAERLLALEDGAAAGACPSCGGLYARGAAYCGRCGNSLTAQGWHISGSGPAAG